MTAAILADFKTEPYYHQLREFELHCEDEARALLWQMRTGKSKVIVDTACHLRRAGIIDAVVLLAPNGVHENWTRRELPTHHWDSVDREALAWRTSVCGELGVGRVAAADREAWREAHEGWWDRFARMLRTRDLAWFAFNTESLTRPDVRRALKRIQRNRRVMVVADESDDFRKPGSKRTRMIRPFASRCAIRRILTGTVVTNSPLHAFSQFELLEPGALGFGTFKEFEAHHAVYRTETTRGGRKYPKLDRYLDLEGLRERIGRWSSVVLREDCEDLPEVLRETRHVPMSEEQRRVYRELHEQFRLEVGGREVSIGENTQRLVKLQQAGSGWLRDEWGDDHVIPGPNPRLEALSDEVYLAPGKVIVWCHFKRDIAAVVERLTADGHEVVEYHGGVGDEQRQRNIDRFKREPGVHFVGQPLAGGRGLDLSEADEIVNYSHTFNAIARQQSAERATAMMGANVRMVDLVANPTDAYILRSVAENIDVADSVAGHGLAELLRRTAL